MKKKDNPFLVYGYHSPEYFCDRKEETGEIIGALRNNCNLTLKSPRRYGKTGLIHNVFYHINEQFPDTKCFYIDIYATKSLADFVHMLGKTVVGQLDTPLQKAEGYAAKFFRSCQLTMSTDLTTGMPQFGLSFEPRDAKLTLKEIFDYIAKSEKTCYIAIDEFQQVTEYHEENVEALLRTYIQDIQNAQFIFSGSKQHMMAEMFDSPKHPFYRSTQKLNLGKLSPSVYYEFVENKLKQKQLHIDENVFLDIYNVVDGVTWYVQAIMNRLYRLDPCEITHEMCMQAIHRIILSEEEDYKRLYHLLTGNQARLLQAIAKEGVVKEPMSGLFIRTHNLKTASSVQRSLKFLVDEEYVYLSEEGYIVYDRFFGIWLKG